MMLGGFKTMRTAVCVVGLVAALLPSEGFACSCGERPTPAQAFSETPAIRLVTVTKVRDRSWFGKRLWYSLFHPESPEYEEYISRFGFEITASVDTTFKGPPASAVRFLTGRGGGDCGLPFEKGRRYLVYLGSFAADGLSIVGYCSRTAPLENASEDLVFLQGHP